MSELSVDGRPVRVPEDATILDAARLLGIEVPTLCRLEGHPHHTSCMVCLVELRGSGSLVPACATPAAEGQEVLTDSAAVRAARRASLDLLLSEHRGDCEAPCRRGCPARADIPRMIRRFAAGDPRGALAVSMDALPLPGSLCRVCPAPCEAHCRRKPADSPVAVRRLQAAAAEACLRGPVPYTPRRKALTGRSVAVVGAGPAGLSAACFLARAGHRCVVFDGKTSPGGMLRAALGDGRLPPDVLEADVDVLRRLGVEFRMGAEVCGREGLEGLRADHDAVVLATGSPGSLAALAPAGAVFDRRTGACGVPGLFAGGNAVRETASRMAARAAADGAALAHAVGLHLAGLPVAARKLRFDSRRGPLAAVDAAPLLAEAQRRAGNRLGASAEEAEALRCLRCDCARGASCGLRRLAEEYGADPRRYGADEDGRIERVEGARGLSFEPGKCIKCGICVRIASRGGDRPGLAFSGRGYGMRVKVPFDGDIGRAIAGTADECVARCPTGALFRDGRAGGRGA